jgi:hypothetical protein
VEGAPPGTQPQLRPRVNGCNGAGNMMRVLVGVRMCMLGAACGRHRLWAERHVLLACRRAVRMYQRRWTEAFWRA